MQKLKSTRFDFVLINSLVFLLFGIAPFYSQPNYGGTGLELTFNITTWMTATVIICSAIMLVTVRKEIRLPQRLLYFISIPVFFILSGLISGTLQPVPYFFREVYIVGGLFFFLALFQFNLRSIQVEQVLLTIVLSTIPHALIGIVQANSIELFNAYSTSAKIGYPTGIFQSANVHASFLATGVAITIYLLTRPLTNRLHPCLLALLILSLAMNSFVIAHSESRLGLYSLILSLLLLVVFRHRQFSSKKILVFIAILAVANGIWLGKDGAMRSMDKTMNMTQGISGDVRISMYKIAFELVSQKPIQGHGIGSFLRVWNLQTSDYYSRHPEAILEGYLKHPHNELLFWIIEGGLIIVTGLLAAMVAVILSLIRCGPQRSIGYIAMLLPITFHTQVELPFFISSVHWFLWLFLVFVIMQHQAHSISCAISQSSIRLIQFTNIVLFAGSIYFLNHTIRAQADIMNYVTGKDTTPPYLQTALRNHYFKQKAEDLLYRATLYNGVNDNNTDAIYSFIEWANEQISIRPELKIFEDLIHAYTGLNDIDSKCKVVKYGNLMYPQNLPLQKLRVACIDRS